MSRDLFTQPALMVAPQLLGSFLTVESDEGQVRIRITEVEAYHGVGTPGPYDPGSHSRDRRTDRNSSMFGPPGHAYVYLSYGMHYALNLVCSPDGSASGVLLRAGEIVEGADIAQARRGAKRDAYGARAGSQIPHHQLARGPGNLATSLGITRSMHDGLDLFTAPFSYSKPLTPAGPIATGPRVGVSGEAGGPSFPWRFWISGDPSVSAYRPGRDIPRTLRAP